MDYKEKLKSHKRMYLWIQEQVKKNKYFDNEDKISDLETLEDMYPQLLNLVENLINDLEKAINKNEKDKWMKFTDEIYKKKNSSS